MGERTPPLTVLCDCSEEHFTVVGSNIFLPEAAEPVSLALRDIRLGKDVDNGEHFELLL